MILLSTAGNIHRWHYINNFANLHDIGNDALDGLYMRNVERSGSGLKLTTSELLARTSYMADRILGLHRETMLAVVGMIWFAFLNTGREQKKLAPICQSRRELRV